MINTDANNKLSFKLEVYEGPLDLLLALISKNKVSIYDIPIAIIFEQYMEYIDAMREMDMEVAGEFINMAAELMLIKSRMILPKAKNDSEEEDPRAALAAALIAYKKAKLAASPLGALYAEYSGRAVKETDEIDVDNSFVAPHELDMLIKAFDRIAKRQRLIAESKNAEAQSNLNAIVVNKITPIDVKVVSILKSIKQNGWASFEDIIMKSQSRSDIVATFLATLQLMAKRIIFIKETDENNIPILEINYDRERRNSERADDFQ